MIDHLAVGVGAAGAGTRVNTLLIDAGRVAGTVRVDDTLGPAVGRHAHIVGQAGAGRDVVGVAALGVGTAGAGQAGIYRPRHRRRRRDFNARALAEGIPRVAGRTLTDGVVIGHLAAGVVATRSRTGVHALLIDAGGELGAVRADHTLGPAVGRGALVAGQAGAHAHTVHLPVLAVGAAGVGVAGLAVLHHRLGRRDELASGQRVARVAGAARANGVVVAHAALRVQTAGSGAGVATLLVHAGQMVGALGVDEALGAAAHVGVADVLWDTLTGAGATALQALCVGATRRWVAGVDNFGRPSNRCNKI